MTQQVGNMGGMGEAFGMMGQGLGMASQIAYENTIGRMMAMQQNRSAQAGVIPVKVAQVQQQQSAYSGAGGGGAMNVDPNINMLPPAGNDG